MVSPPDKNGANVVADTSRTRASVNGDALATPTSVPLAKSSAPTSRPTTSPTAPPIPNRATTVWHSHAISPDQLPNNGQGLANATSGLLNAVYEGEFSPDLSRGIVPSFTPQTEDPNVADVPNLYRRSDLLQPGKGQYELLSACPRCTELAEPLAPAPLTNSTGTLRAQLDWASPDLSHVIFESKQRLTSDTPPASPGCTFLPL